ncbi:MAG: L-threonylcarbamoyladenylate synthase [Candidatus Bathyarchaeia archaeon]
MKKTLVLKVDSQNPELEKIHVAADLIKKGGLVAFPTETVYGLGADALNPTAVLALFEAKKRPLDNPPIVHVGKVNEVYRLVTEVSPKAKMLMEKFWPGPLTLIFKRSEIVPKVTVAGLDTIAIRMPKHNVALALLRESGCPIAAPSANLAGKPSPTRAEHVLEDLNGRIDAILDAGQTNIGVESTVLDLTHDPPQVLRPGGTPYEDLKKILKNVELHPVATAEREVPIEKAHSPGVKHKHYAPRAEVIVVEGELSAIIDKVKDLAEQHTQKGLKVGILATDETTTYYGSYMVKSLGSRSNLAAIAKNLFRLLREFDQENVDVIIAEGVPPKELGLAVMNRLRRAAGYRIVKACNRGNC